LSVDELLSRYAARVYRLTGRYKEAARRMGLDRWTVKAKVELYLDSCSVRCLQSEKESTIIQDIFNLVYRAYIVVVDFTGKNPDVMLDNVPFDIRHHPVQKYFPNRECADLWLKLTAKLNK
jgi:hypothetical protein